MINDKPTDENDQLFSSQTFKLSPTLVPTNEAFVRYEMMS